MKTLSDIKEIINKIIGKIKGILHKTAPMILGLSLVSTNIQASSCIDRMLSCLNITLQEHSLVGNIIDSNINPDIQANSMMNNDIVTSLSNNFGIDIKKLINIHSDILDIKDIGMELPFGGKIFNKEEIKARWENATSEIIDRYFELVTSKILGINNINPSGISSKLNNKFQELSDLARQLYVREEWIKNSKEILKSETLKKVELSTLEKDITFTIESILSPLFRTLTQLEASLSKANSRTEAALIKQSQILQTLSHRISTAIEMEVHQGRQLDLTQINKLADRIEIKITEAIKTIQNNLQDTLQLTILPSPKNQDRDIANINSEIETYF